MKIMEFSDKLEKAFYTNAERKDIYVTCAFGECGDFMVFDYKRYKGNFPGFIEISKGYMMDQTHELYLILNDNELRVILRVFYHGLQIDLVNEKFLTINENKDQEMYENIINYIKQEVQHVKE